MGVSLIKREYKVSLSFLRVLVILLLFVNPISVVFFQESSIVLHRLMFSVIFCLCLMNLLHNKHKVVWDEPSLPTMERLAILRRKGEKNYTCPQKPMTTSTLDQSDEARLRFQAHLLENIQKSIMVLSTDGELIYYNQEARNIFGIVSGNGFLWQENLPFDTEKVMAIKAQVLSGSIWEEEQRLLIEGHEETFLHHVHGLFLDDRTAYIVIISTDISDLVNARINAEYANLSKSQFLANMTHELRTPMIGILGSAELMEQDPLLVQLEHINTIKHCGEHLLKTIDEILDVSKIDLGLLQLNLSTVDLHQVLEKLSHVIDEIIIEKNLIFEVNLDQQLKQMTIMDEVKLRHIISHLLYNAVKFTSHGRIQLQAELETDRFDTSSLLIRVSDTGIGIPPDKIAHVFDPFTQVDNSSCRVYGGTGLGLYNCKKIIELMKGSIWAESIEGQGSSFYFKIPLSIISGEPLENHNDATDSSRIIDFEAFNGLCTVSVLVVEDNPLNQKLISRMLSHYGFEISTAMNGLECLKTLDQGDFDIILMDMQMPVMDGYEASRRIRDNSSTAEIPIIAITANAMPGNRERCLACGCTSYIAKPFKTEALVQEIKNCLKTGFKRKKSNTLFANEIIAELLPEFLDSMKSMFQDLDAAILTGNLKEIQETCHAIKGTAGMYGFNQMSELAAKMEQASQDASLNRMNVLFVQLSAMLEQLSLELGSTAYSRSLP